MAHWGMDRQRAWDLKVARQHAETIGVPGDVASAARAIAVDAKDAIVATEEQIRAVYFAMGRALRGGWNAPSMLVGAYRSAAIEGSRAACVYLARIAHDVLMNAPVIDAAQGEGRHV